MPTFKLAFKAFALTHPDIGAPLENEEDGDQLTTKGLLSYNSILDVVVFFPATVSRGADYVVTTADLHLRDGPALAATIILDDIGKGRTVHSPVEQTVPADNYHWRYVQVEDGVEGWCADEYLSLTTKDEGLTDEPDRQFTLAELWPTIIGECRLYGFDPHVLAAVAYQESKFKNFRVHADGTGHGLLGFDDNGHMASLEKFAGRQFGRGPSANIIPPVLQFKYAARYFAGATVRLGEWNAVRAWYTGEGNFESGAGRNYEALIRKWVGTLDFPA